MRALRVTAVVLASLLLVTGCSDDNSKAQDAADKIAKQIEDTANDTGGGLPGGTLPTGGKSDCPEFKDTVGRMRVVNLATDLDGTAEPVDVYAAGYGPLQGCKPLIENLGYGEVSDYVDVPARQFSDEESGGLMYIDAGSTEMDGFWRGNSPNDGVDGEGDQETVVLSGGSTEGQADPTWMNVIEHSKEDPSQDVEAKAGKGLLLVSGGPMSNTFQRAGDKSVISFSIDGECLYADNDQSGHGILNGNGTPFSVAPGEHTVGLIITDPGVGIGGQDCDGHEPKFTKDVTVEAGKALAVYIGAKSPSDATILTAPID
ncbi:MAG: DUF4397 domain-containing protein [Acidimicrobiales bacterium]|nr:DUF4397 domain-containing protein [Acidimicrobiales bacterium]